MASPLQGFQGRLSGIMPQPVVSFALDVFAAHDWVEKPLVTSTKVSSTTIVSVAAPSGTPCLFFRSNRGWCSVFTDVVVSQPAQNQVPLSLVDS
jgi:hypothetical protein